MAKRDNKHRGRAGAIRRAFDPAGVAGRLADELVAMTKSTQKLSVDDVIPDAEAPDPSRLRANVPSRPEPPDDQVVRAQACALLGEHVSKPRPFGATVEAEDTFTITTLGFAAGVVVPFTARFEERVAPDEELLPGLREAVVGKTVGETVVVNVVIPTGVPGQPYAGQDIRMVAEIVSARPVTKVELSEESVTSSGLASDVAALEAQARGLVAGRLEEDWRAEARQVVLHAALGQRPVTVPDSATAVLVEQMWRERELPVLERMNVLAAEQRALLETWMDSHEIVADARVRLATTAIVRAYGQAVGVRANARAATRKTIDAATGLDGHDRAAAVADVLLGDVPAAGDAAHWYLAALDALVDDTLRA